MAEQAKKRPSVSNIELKRMLEERWTQTDINTAKIKEHSIILSNHDRILNGDPGDYKDQGIVGLINDMAALVENIKAWVKPLIIALLSWALLGGIQKLLDVVKTVEQLAQ